MARLSSPSGKTLTPDVDRLGLCVELDCGDPLFARAVTGLAASAEWDMVIYSCGRQVDHHHPRPDVAAEMPRMLERIGDDPRREPELTAIGDLQRFLVILDLHRAGDRPEDLFAIDALVGRGVGVVEHDERVLAAHLELHARLALHRGFADACADHLRSGERNPVDVGMADDRSSDVAFTDY